MLSYHSGTVLEIAVNRSTILAETVLGILIVCLPGGPKLLTKIIPVVKMVSAYLFDLVR